jgi:tRNA 2-thiouridine synthesizing protein A
VSRFGRKTRHQAPPGEGDGGTGSPPEEALLINALGRKCPVPIIWAAQRIGEVPIGGVIGVLADDPAAYTDIPSWCAMKSHELVSRDPHSPNGWHFQIRRQY